MALANHLAPSHRAVLRISSTVPDFLAPRLASQTVLPLTKVLHFSTSPRSPYPRDRNPNRGVSPLRRTGLPHPLSVDKFPLPKPVRDPSKKTKLKVDKNHGLWEFFNKDKEPLSDPVDDAAYGRSWTVEELRKKSWEDLHRLWWVCAKERNRIETYTVERRRLEAGFGDVEAADRESTVRKTQRAIKHTLTERWYAWEHARELAMTDPAIDLSGDGPALLRQQGPSLEELDAMATGEEPRAAAATKR